MTDHAKLRQLAENATQDTWSLQIEEVGDVHDADILIYAGPFEFGGGCDPEQTIHDAEFIAAANPVTVLALLDELRDAKATGSADGYITGRDDLATEQSFPTPNPYREDPR